MVDASFRRRVSGLSVRNTNPPALAGGCLVDWALDFVAVNRIKNIAIVVFHIVKNTIALLLNGLKFIPSSCVD